GVPDEDAEPDSPGAACLRVPPTIAALLAARFDRLPGQERSVLQIGSVAGAVFARDAVADLSPAEARGAVDSDLAALTRRRFVRPEEGLAGSPESYRFEHVLVRDTAYGSMLKRTRADLHERFADWLAAAPAGRALEQEEVVGYHLEQAYRCLSELGPVDARGVALGRRAWARLSAAGRRALAQGDMPAAAGLLQRAMAVLPEGDRDRLELVPDITEALLEMGAPDRALVLVDAAEAACAEAGGEVQRIRLRLAGHHLRRLSASSEWAETVTADVAHALPILEEAGDHVTQARAWRLLSAVHGAASRFGPSAEALQEAIAHARRAGDRRMERRNYHTLAVCQMLGDTPVPEAQATCRRLLEDSAGDRRTAALLMSVLSVLAAMRGDVEESRRLQARAHDALEELGNRLTAAVASFFHSRAELLAGDPVRAEAVVRPSLEALQRFGAMDYVCTAANLLGDALCAQGRWEEAEAASRIAETAARDDDTDARSRWRSIRARALARSDAPQAAVVLAGQGVELARRTDSPVLLGLALLDLAEVGELAGSRDTSTAAASEALRLLDAKGDLVSAARARELLGGVPVVGEPHTRRKPARPLARAAGG
ncbi:MAG TPA: hypothetical protein VFO60_07030, partial [Candidatus Dormibacteraeota bacterium]|nr:hypothetical protein [Candidatus Dormibacteraeota bacterium]